MLNNNVQSEYKLSYVAWSEKMCAPFLPAKFSWPIWWWNLNFKDDYECITSTALQVSILSLFKTKEEYFYLTATLQLPKKAIKWFHVEILISPWFQMSFWPSIAVFFFRQIISACAVKIWMEIYCSIICF